MKTSQKWGSFMKNNAYFHLRFFQLNIATGLFKSFLHTGSDKREKNTLDLRNKVIMVKRLACKLKDDYLAIMEQLNEHKVKELALPYDYRYPLSVIYLDNMCVVTKKQPL